MIDLSLSATAEALMEAVPDALVVVDAGGRMIIINREAERLFGFERTDLLGQPFEMLVPERFRASEAKRRASFFGDPRLRPKVCGVEVCGLRKNGAELPIEIRSTILETVQGWLVSSTIRDISDRRPSERRARQANRLKSEFLANMSHELRTPLNAIIGFADLINDGEVDVDSPQYKEFLGHILASGRHLLRLVNDILDLSKVEAGKMEFRLESVDLTGVVVEIVSMLGTTASRKGIRVAVSVPPEMGEVMIDPARFKQVVYNYLSNALKFTPEAGQVTVRVIPATDGSFRLEVEDNGIGIKGNDLKRLFIEFQQLDAVFTKKHAGTGLGLALTKRIVEAQGGSVEVRSVYGQGSVFSATFLDGGIDHLAPSLPTTTSSSSSAASVDAVRPVVLVVEDHEKDRRLLLRTLTRAGYALVTVSNGAEALARFYTGRFAAVTLDLALPDMSGLQVLHEIRRGDRCPEVPVIILSLMTETHVMSGFRVHDVLTKPMDGSMVLASLRRAVVAAASAGSVLVVDDDPRSLRLIENSLVRAGYRAECLDDPAAALEAAGASPPAAAILDLLMPLMSGFEFLDRFRSQWANRDVPVIVWTAKDLTPTERRRLAKKARSVHHKIGDGVDGLLAELRGIVPPAPLRQEDG